jgi:superfamily II DNA/RNA helicase
MRQFMDGTLRVLIATEAAGMVNNFALVIDSAVLTGIQGCDISDIEETIQYGTPSSISQMLQRGGRGGRRADIKSLMIVVFEKTAFKSRLMSAKDKAKS